MNNYSIRKEKIALRNSILEKRDTQGIAQIQEKSQSIKDRLFELKEFKNAKNIMFFVSFRSEVMTDFMIKEALNIGKKIIVPRAEKHTKALDLFYLNDFYTDLTFGAYGILEPKPDQCKHAKKSDVDIIIVPGSVFSEKGDRLGYGAGYYDRFFKNIPSVIPKIALAFELQFVDNVPVGDDDVSMDIIVTEKRTIICKK